MRERTGGAGGAQKSKLLWKGAAISLVLLVLAFPVLQPLHAMVQGSQFGVVGQEKSVRGTVVLPGNADEYWDGYPVVSGDVSIVVHCGPPLSDDYCLHKAIKDRALPVEIDVTYFSYNTALGERNVLLSARSGKNILTSSSDQYRSWSSLKYIYNIARGEYVPTKLDVFFWFYYFAITLLFIFALYHLAITIISAAKIFVKAKKND